MLIMGAVLGSLDFVFTKIIGAVLG